MNSDIELLKEFKKIHPWSGNYYKKKDKFICLLNRLCVSYDLEIPKLLVPKNPKIFKWTTNRCGDCNFYLKKIRIANFSIITFLHEFKHWIDLNKYPKFRFMENKKEREWRAYYYSNRLFYTVWPERIKTLQELKKYKNISEPERLINMCKDNKNIKLEEHAFMNAFIDIILDRGFRC